MPKNTNDPAKLVVPAASWAMVKKVIRAYGATSGDDPSGGEVADLAGLQRTVVSACNKFLRNTGIVQPDRNKLTELGNQLSTAWSIENAPMALEALQRIVTSAPTLMQLVNTVRARGSMATDLLKGQIIVAAGLTGDSFLVPYVRTIVEMLDESKLIQVVDDTVTPGTRPADGIGTPLRSEQQQRSGDEGKSLRQGDNERFDGGKNQERTRMPLPFGPSRLGYIELPPDWDNKELPKLLKMLELVLGDDA